MGHRSSKSAITNASTSADLYINHNNTTTATTAETPARRPTDPLWQNNGSTNSSNRIPIPLPGTTINVQIQESPTIDTGAGNSQQQQSESDTSSLNSLQNRQIIIKIQLAKMEENANESSAATAASEVAETSVNAVNVTLNGNFIYADEGVTSELASLSSTSSRNSRTAGGSTNLTNNNNKSNLNKSTTLEHNNDLQIRLNALHIQEDWEQQQSNDSMPEYCEVLEESFGSNATSTSVMKETNEPRRSETSLPDNVGCLSARRKSKTSSRPSSTSSLSSVMLSRRRCRDAIRRILEPTSKSSSNKNKEQNNSKHSENVTPQPPLPALPSTSNAVLPSTSGRSETRRQSLHQNQQKLINTTNASNSSLMPISITTVGGSGVSVGTSASTSTTINTNTTIATTSNANPLSTAIWTPSRNDLIIPITSPPQFVVVQCAPSSVVTLGRIDDNAIRLTSTDVGSAVNAFAATTTQLTRSMSNGPIVHSQVDFVHCLVPDLDKIVNSSFYWGKIDRYEAERLLEGKPEGTFLLRDSAQEEYLFSVTFRKYGRSLHARIEQSGHKFGFDCHDPGVFTAPTVTGLLQHYKDPACVMFFEPMLTIPLHRKTVFSLEQLARAAIVSNTTYDGINELGLPVRVKSFLKEYHYKQKLRVKPCDEPFYSCT